MLFPTARPVVWPHGKKFAFTIVDDTDGARLDGIRRVYDVIADAGLRTTKTVWPLRPLGRPRIGGDSLETPGYASWVRELKAAGFEIAFHGAADGTSPRAHIIEALDRFRQELGEDPVIHANHVGQTEALYWGPARFDAPWNWTYSTYRAIRRYPIDSCGHIESSKLFWGDLCRQRIRFVRNLVFPEINTLAVDPFMPYHDPRRPYVKYWFSASDGSGAPRFFDLLSEANQDRLAQEGGACIVYSHLAAFQDVPDRFRSLLHRIGRMDGWFVPASELLEYVGRERGWVNISNHTLRHRAMQAEWLCRGALARFRGLPAMPPPPVEDPAHAGRAL